MELPKYTNNLQVMLMRLMSKGEYLIVPKGTKFTGSGKLRLTVPWNAIISHPSLHFTLTVGELIISIFFCRSILRYGALPITVHELADILFVCSIFKPLYEHFTVLFIMVVLGISF